RQRITDFVGSRQRRPGRHGNDGKYRTLIFVRQQRTRYLCRYTPDRSNHDGAQGQADYHPAQQQIGQVYIAAGQLRKAGIEHAKRPCRLLRRLQERGTQCGGQGQGRKAGHRDGDRNRNRELAIQLARQTAQETYRNEYGAQYQHDRHDRTADLAHGLNRGFARRLAILGHDALDVFDHHDGVVHYHANGENQTKQRQQIDGKAQQPNTDEGSYDRYRNRQQGNDGGTNVL